MCHGALARCRLAEHEAQRENERRMRRGKKGKGIVGGAKGWSKSGKDWEEKKEGGEEGGRRRKVRASAHLHKQGSEAPGAQGPCKVAHQI